MKVGECFHLSARHSAGVLARRRRHLDPVAPFTTSVQLSSIPFLVLAVNGRLVSLGFVAVASVFEEDGTHEAHNRGDLSGSAKECWKR